MNLFDSPEKKWIKNHQASAWNRMFTHFSEVDAMITKLMVYECVHFTDSLLNSSAFCATNQALRIDTILLAKMHFYHLVTQSATVHNLFYGYIEELWVNHYHEDLETAHNALSRMRNQEKWYQTWYYSYYEQESGDYKKVLDSYCKSAKRNRTPDDVLVCQISEDDLKHTAAIELSKMHLSFMQVVSSLSRSV